MSKNISKDKFKVMISEMEQSAMKDNQKCNIKCNKIKTNFAKDKKKLSQKKKCHGKCEKKRMKSVKSFHAKYPKEYKRFINSLGGGKRVKKRTSKKDKYICYTGIGSNNSGNHTKKDFLKVMNRNKYNFNEPVPKEIKTIEQWIKFVGAEKGKCNQSGGKNIKKKKGKKSKKKINK